MNFSRKPPAPRKPRAAVRRTRINTYYRAEPAAGGSSPFQRKPAAKNVRRFLFGFLDITLILVILAGLGYSLVISPKPRIIVSNQTFHRNSDYQAYANQLFSQIKNRNKITYDEKAVVLAMEKRFPEITSISTELPIFSEQPTLRIAISKASLRVRSGSNNYIVDSQGVIVAHAGQLAAAGSLPQIIDQSGFNSKIGQPLLNVGAVDFIRTVMAEIKAAKVPVSAMTLPPVAQELDLRTSDRPYFVKFYLGGDALVQAGQYLAARNHFNQTGQQPAQYLDVRVGGKIFYK